MNKGNLIASIVGVALGGCASYKYGCVGNYRSCDTNYRRAVAPVVRPYEPPRAVISPEKPKPLMATSLEGRTEHDPENYVCVDGACWKP